MNNPNFSSVLTETRERKLKSDLENLAQAHLFVESAIINLYDLRDRIAAVAENPSAHPEGTVRKLYDEASRVARA